MMDGRVMDDGWVMEGGMGDGWMGDGWIKEQMTDDVWKDERTDEMTGDVWNERTDAGRKGFKEKDNGRGGKRKPPARWLPDPLERRAHLSFSLPPGTCV